jgi:hypothetical protein
VFITNVALTVFWDDIAEEKVFDKIAIVHIAVLREVNPE